MIGKVPPRGVGAVATAATVATERVRLSDVLDRLGALGPVSTHVAETFLDRWNGPFVRAFRNEHMAVRQLNTEPEALGLLLAHLARVSGYAPELELSSLRALGPDGVRVAQLLQHALAGPPSPVSAKQRAEVTQQALNCLTMTGRSQLSPLLTKVQAGPSDGLLPARPTRRAEPSRPPANAVGFSELLKQLTYGGDAVTRLTDSLLSRTAEGPLAKRMVSGTKPIDDEADRTARLLEVLWAYRTDTEAGPVFDAPRFMLDFPAEGPGVLRALRDAAAQVQPDRLNMVAMAQVVRRLGRGPDSWPLIKALVHGEGLIPQKLGSLEAVKALVPDSSLKGKGLIAAQHLLTNTVPLIEACIEKGMDPRDIHVAGTPYNNNPLAIAYLELLGVNVVEGHDNLGSTRHLKEGKLQELEHFVSAVASRSPPPNGWKVLDDGGLLQKVMTGAERSEYGRHHPDPQALAELFRFENTEAVEQTTRGLTEVPDPRFPTVAVARAKGKKLEGEYIGWALADSLVFELKQRGYDLTKTRLNVAGAGTIGLWAAELLRQEGLDVGILDIRPEVLEQAKARGFRATSDAAQSLEDTDVTLSCSGKNIWPGSVLADYDGLMLSGSSMAAEFDEDQINSFRTTPLKVGNLGRPINFHGDGHAVLDPEEIGITLALLFAGVAQPRAETKGYVDVEPTLEKAAIDAWPRAKGAAVRPIAKQESKARRPDFTIPDGSATHEQWLAYLSSKRQPVFPQPNSTRGRAPQYFFIDEAQRTRFVDTRTGVSQEVDLPGVPVEGFPLNHRGDRYYLVTKDGDQRIAWMADLTEPTAKFERLGPMKQLRAQYVRDDTLSEGEYRAEAGVVLEVGDTLKVLAPEAERWVDFPKAKGPAFVVWPHSTVVLQLQKKPPALTMLDLGGSSMGRSWAAVRLPSELVEVVAVGRLPRSSAQVAVGKTAEGRTMISVLDPIATPSFGEQKHLKPAVLPEGATYRGIRPGTKGLYGHFIVDFTLPGDPVELSSYRQVEFDLLADVLEGLQR